jgi:hypothetical protein
VCSSTLIIMLLLCCVSLELYFSLDLVFFNGKICRLVLEIRQMPLSESSLGHVSLENISYLKGTRGKNN